MPDMKHAEHVTVPETWPSDCLEGECEHRDEDGEPEGLDLCPSSPFEVCLDCMDEEGFGRDPEQWDDTPLEAWPHPGSEGWHEMAPALADIVSPDCRDGKCAACTGDAWNDTTDEPTDCQHACHGQENQ